MSFHVLYSSNNKKFKSESLLTQFILAIILALIIECIALAVLTISIWIFMPEVLIDGLEKFVLENGYYICCMAPRPVMNVPDPTGVFNGLYNPNVSSQPAARNLANALAQIAGELSSNLFPGNSGR
jgi:hypothetical protein